MTARQVYEDWFKAENLPDYLQRQLKELNQNSAWADDAFGTDINLGTARMRGLLEPGTNRTNVVTAGRVTEGLAQLIEKKGQEVKEKGVVISFDSRYHSEGLTKFSVQILNYRGIKVYLFDGPRPTPGLSLAIRHFGTFAGIMVTTSHNAKQYNGYRTYGTGGGQMPPEHTAVVEKVALGVEDQLAIPVSPIEELCTRNILQLVGEDVDGTYLETLDTININHDLIKEAADELKIVYVPIHGTGKVIHDRAFRQGGFKNFIVIPGQAITDPEFPTTIKSSPEYRQVFDEGIKVADKVGADAIVATDPDVNRLDAAARTPNGGLQALIGNQVATLISSYLLTNSKNSGKLDSSYKIITSIASSFLPFKVVKPLGIQTKYVLIGFKYIGEEIDRLHRIGDGQSLMGLEESYGFLFKTSDRNEDAMQGVLAFSEVAAYYASRNMSVFDGLQEVWNECGTSCEIAKAVEMPGLDGQKRMAEVMENLYKEQPKKTSGHRVVGIEDFELTKEVTETGERGLVGFPESNVPKHFLGDETWAALHSSGAKPVIKTYVGISAGTYAKTEEKCKAYHDATTKFTK